MGRVVSVGAAWGLVAAIAWMAGCSGRVSPPNLPPPEYEAPRPFAPPPPPTEAEPVPEPAMPESSAPAPVDAPPATDTDAGVPAASGDAGVEAR